MFSLYLEAAEKLCGHARTSMVYKCGANNKSLQQDAQNGRPARPQRVKGRGVPSGYVEGLNDARTMLADFFSILLDRLKALWHIMAWVIDQGTHRVGLEFLAQIRT